MSFLTTIFLAVGLAMDAFAVSVTAGIVSKGVGFVYSLRIALFFAFFQMMMPCLGWWLGQNIAGHISRYDHWIAFMLLSIIGGKMIYESLQDKGACKSFDFNKTSVLLFLAFVTSIDALIAGASLSILEIDLMFAIFTIGLITLLLSLIGVNIGKILGCLVEKYAQIIGGVILVLIGFQVLAKHLQLL